MTNLNLDRRLFAYALAVAALISAALIVRDLASLPVGLGDTDDATRLVLMRELAHGRGWWDQLVTRLSPPFGTWLHWSRLIDGGMAVLDRALAPIFGEAGAETGVRIVWPLLWIVPGLVGAFAAARRLAGPGERGGALASHAVLAAGVIALVYFTQLTLQFRPGRVDHHDVQIALCVLSLAGAMTRGPGIRGAVLAAVATGLGMAIGLEALLFEAAFAASFGVRLLFDPAEAPRARAFGLTLAGVTLAAFLIQTPPGRWGVPACDALGSNLLAGTMAAGLGLAAAAQATRGRGWAWRLLALTLAGAVALGVYLALDPHCTKGIFADVDPAIRPFWLDHVNEVKPIGRVWKSARPDAVAIAVACLMATGSWIALGLVPARRRDPAWWVMGVAIALGIVAACTAIRMRSYIEWFAVVPLAVAAAEAGARAGTQARFVTLLCAVLFHARAADGRHPDRRRRATGEALADHAPAPHRTRDGGDRDDAVALLAHGLALGRHARGGGRAARGARGRDPLRRRPRQGPPGAQEEGHARPLLRPRELHPAGPRAGRADDQRDRPRPLRAGAYAELGHERALPPHEPRHPPRARRDDRLGRRRGAGGGAGQGAGAGRGGARGHRLHPGMPRARQARRPRLPARHRPAAPARLRRRARLARADHPRQGQPAHLSSARARAPTRARTRTRAR